MKVIKIIGLCFLLNSNSFSSICKDEYRTINGVQIQRYIDVFSEEGSDSEGLKQVF